MACESSGELVDVLVIFLSRGRIDMTLLDDEIQTSLKTDDPLPDAVVLLSFTPHAAEIVNALKEHATHAAGLVRRGRRFDLDYLKEIAVWTFSAGEFSKAFSTGTSSRSYVFNVPRLVSHGLRLLVDQRKAFQEAPAGHVFRHPSGRQTRYFLLASQLLIDEIDAYFVGLAVCSKAWPQLSKATTLHIDTMGIYPVARAVEDIVHRCGGDGADWEIASFHSHQGMADLYSVVEDSDVVLVSASTSGSMVKALADDGAPDRALITLLDVSDEGRRGTVVYAHERDQPEAISFARSSSELVIDLAGEYFAVQGKKPRPFVLTKAHQPSALQAFLSQFSSRAALGLHKPRSAMPSKRDWISLDEERVADNEEFKQWLAEDIRLRTPVSVTHVLHLDGPGGRLMAQHSAKVIDGLTGRASKIVTLQELATEAKANSANISGVLICVAVVGDGHSLRTIARDLRELVPSAARHFIAAVGLPKTFQAWTRLQQFLVQSGSKDRPYLFSAWQVLPTGVPTGFGDAWSRTETLMQRAEQLPLLDHSPWRGEHFQSSLTELARTLEARRSTYLQTVNGQDLRLTRGFVYWNPINAVRAASDHAAVSLLAVSSALQNARESGGASARLTSSIHETVVLDVENFLRFNDGVLQASILRAADCHELDYSGSPELSEMMREFLEKVFTNASRPYGDAAPEFALSLATGRLKLTKEDSRSLLKAVADKIPPSSTLLGLMYVWWLLIEGKHPGI